MEIRKIVSGGFGVNTYVLLSTDKNSAAVIDPSVPSEEIIDAVRGLNLEYIVNTHGHFDHIGGNALVKMKTGAKIVIHEADADKLIDPSKNLSVLLGLQTVSEPADVLLRDGMGTLVMAGKTFEVIAVPGHSEGCVAFYQKENGVLFSGDFIFNGAIGRTDFPGSDFKQMQNSLVKILDLPDNVKVYPGHDEDFILGNAKKDLRFYLRGLE